MSEELARGLAHRGYLVLRLAPDQVFRYIAFPGQYTDTLPGLAAGAWVAVHEPSGGFSEIEARAVTRSRGGAVVEK